MNSKDLLNALIMEKRGIWKDVYKAIRDKVHPTFEGGMNAPDNFVFILGENYPEKLKFVAEPPIGFYCEGDTNLLSSKEILYLGDDTLSLSGVPNILNNKSKNKIVISNLKGISDEKIIEHALNNGNKVILVSTNSLDEVKNEFNDLTNKVLKHGGLIMSEFPFKLNENELEYAATRSQMITAGLADQIVLLDAKSKDTNASRIFISGISMNKDLYVFPSNNLNSVNYEYLKMGAPLITEAKDLYLEQTSSKDMEMGE